MTTATLGVSAEGVAAAGLPGTFHTWPAQPLPAEEWAQLLRDCARQRLVGLLLLAVDRGLLPVEDHQLDEALEEQAKAMTGALLLEGLLLDTVAVLDSAGLDSRVIKGCAVANLDYPAPEQRAYSDVDLLVRAEEVADVLATLTAAGLSRVFQPPTRGWDRRFGKGALLRSQDGLELDLHRTLATAPLGLLLRLDDLWVEPARLVLGGRSLKALPRELRLLNAAYSAAVGDTVASVATLRDLAQLALHPDLDTGQVRELATSWGGGAVLAAAVRATWEALRIGDITGLSAWAAAYRPKPDELRILALYQGSRASETTRALATLTLLPGYWTRLRYGASLAFARSGYTRASTAGPLGRLVRGFRQLRTTKDTAR